MKNKAFFIIGISCVSALALVAIFAGVIAPFDPSAIVGEPFLKPNSVNLLGTNDIGQDIFSELVVGARYSLAVGFIATLVSASLAIVIGMIAGWFGGVIDSVLMKVSAFVMAVPYIPFILVISTFLNGSIWATSVVMGITSWPEMARVIRAQILKLKNNEYITSIIAMGAGDRYILTKHISRELMPLIAYRVASRFRSTILAESALSFLGMAPSVIKSWGKMLYYAQSRNAFLTGAWVWWAVPPGVMITLLILGITMISYSIEDRMDPRLEKRA